MPGLRPCFTALFLPLTAGGFLAGQAIARPGCAAAAPAAERSPFLGEWELDLTRMPDTYGTPPKRVTFAFSDIGSGRWLTQVAITGPDGSLRQAAIRYRRDGRAVPTEGDKIDGDSAALNSPAPNVLVLNLATQGGPQSVRVYVISADGQEMTESAAGRNDEGAPFVRSFHFKRIR